MLKEMGLSRRGFIAIFAVPLVWFFCAALLSNITIVLLGLVLLVIEIKLVKPLAQRRDTIWIWGLLFGCAILLTIGLWSTKVSLEIWWQLLAALLSAVSMYLSAGVFIVLLFLELKPYLPSLDLGILQHWQELDSVKKQGICFWGIVLLAMTISRNFALPVAVLLASLNRLSKTERSPSWFSQVISSTTRVVTMIMAYFISSLLLRLSNLSSLLPIEPVSDLTAIIGSYWVIFAILIAMGNLLYQLPRLSLGLKAVIVGTAAAVLLVELLNYPIYTLAYNFSVPEMKYSGVMHEIVTEVTLICAAVITLLTGPLIVIWGQPKGRLLRFLIGAMTLTLASEIIFGFIGAPTVGLVAQRALYGVSVSRSGYDEADYLLKLALNINTLFPALFGATWGLIIGGIIIGGITALLTPPFSSTPDESSQQFLERFMFDLAEAGIGSFLINILSGILAAVILEELMKSVRDILDSFGNISGWRPMWTLPFLLAQFWVFAIFLQIFALLSIWHKERTLSSLSLSKIEAKNYMFQQVISNYITGISVVAQIVSLFAMLNAETLFSEPIFEIILLITIALSLEILASTQALQKKLESIEHSEVATSKQIQSWELKEWTGGDLVVGGLFSAVLNYQFVGAILSLVLITIAMLTEVANVHTSPPGLDWLDNILATSFSLTQFIFLPFGLAITALGLSPNTLFLPMFLIYVPWANRVAALLPTKESSQTSEESHPAIMTFWNILRDPKSFQLIGLFLLLVAMLMASSNALGIWPALGSKLEKFSSGAPVIVGTIIATIATLLLVRDYDLQYFSGRRLGLIFGTAWIGSVSLALHTRFQLPLNTLVGSLVYVLLVGPSIAISYRAALRYAAPRRTRTMIRLTILLGIAFLIGLSGYVNRMGVAVDGGVTLFDGQTWQTFTSETSAIGGKMNYRFFEDRRKRLWVGGETGLIAVQEAGGWHSYLMNSIVNDSSLYTQNQEHLSDVPIRFLEDKQGHLWVAHGLDIKRFDSAMGFFEPGYIEPHTIGIENNENEVTGLLEPRAAIGVARVLDNQGHTIATLIGHKSAVMQISFGPDEERIMTRGSDGTVCLWTKEGRLISIFENRVSNTKLIAFSSDGQLIAIIDDDNGIHILDANTGQTVVTWLDELDSYSTESVYFSAGNQWLMINSILSNSLEKPTQKAQIWEISTGQQAAFLYAKVALAAFSPDGRQVVTLNNEASLVQIWELTTGHENLALNMNKDEIAGIQFSPDGQWVMTTGQNVRIWDTKTGQELAVLHASGEVVSAAFNSDGQKVMTIGRPLVSTLMKELETKEVWEVYVWDVKTGHKIATLGKYEGGVTSAIFSPDGYFAVIEGYNYDNTESDLGLLEQDTIREVCIWEITTGRKVATLMEQRSPDFNFDGHYLLTLDNNNVVHLWETKTGEEIAALKPYAGQINAASFNPNDNHLVTAESVNSKNYHTLELNADSPIVDVAVDFRGDLWLATAGDGAVRLDGTYQFGNSTWEFFTTENSGLTSDRINVIQTDEMGNVWFGTDRGLVRFDGERWEIVEFSDIHNAIPVTTLLKDSSGRLWVGNIDGGYYWDRQTWVALVDTEGWPEGTEIKAFFEDSLGGLWTGTNNGALRFDGHRWANLMPDTSVEVFDEGPEGIIWAGGKTGLVRYELASDQLNFFYANNGNLPANWVRDVHVDSEENLWISTYTVENVTRSPWLTISFSFLFWGLLFVSTYRGYQLAPETHARQCGQQIISAPEILYPVAYELSNTVSDAFKTLIKLAVRLWLAGDKVGAKTVAAIAALFSERSVDDVVQQNIEALEADITRAWAQCLHQFYGLLKVTLAARHLFEIVNLELTVNPGRETGSIAIYARSIVLETLPSFLSQGTIETWYELERVATTLRKYQDVDTATDRLGYLADALAIVQVAQTKAQSVQPAIKKVMVTIVDRWRTVVESEIGIVSGSAELSLELRTRQVRKASQVTIVLRVCNNGRATAENVVVLLQPTEFFSLVNETQITLERLPSGQSIPIEFTMIPKDADTVRIACHVTWDDRATKNNTIMFADRVRFYEASEAFEKIPNPYIVGHPVKSTQMFHGREDTFEFIEDNLSGAIQDRTLVIYGQRRTGKTSILYQLLQGRLGENFLPVLVDMQELVLLINNTADFLSELAYLIARTARKSGIPIEEPKSDTFALLPTRVFNRFLDDLEDKLDDRRVVVMFDEFELIENKILEGKLDKDILNYFRSLIQHRNGLIFLFTGTHRLEEMSQDYWSTFFNIALYRRVSFLKVSDAIRLIREPVAGALDIDQLAIDKILQLTRGHAYFTQLICWALVNYCNANKRNYATLNDLNEVMQDILMTGEAHFAYIWQQASNIERLAMVGLAYTLQPGKSWARPIEILETLSTNGETRIDRAMLIEALDCLVIREVLIIAPDGVLRYQYQLELMYLWIKTSKSIAALVEREQ